MSIGQEARCPIPSRYSVLGKNVLVKQEKQNKLTTAFNPAPYTVVSKKGNSVIVENPEGVQYSRNTSHVKKFIQENFDTPELSTPKIPPALKEVNTESLERPVTEAAKPKKVQSDLPTRDAVVAGPPQGSRPQRTRKLPARLNDYVVSRS